MKLEGCDEPVNLNGRPWVNQVLNTTARPTRSQSEAWLAVDMMPADDQQRGPAIRA